MRYREGKTPIRQVLQGSPLGAVILDLVETAKLRLVDAQKSSKGHGQGSGHCKNVEENLSRLIPDDWKGSRVNASELFVLSATAWLHDNGKTDPSSTDHGKTGADEIRTNWKDYKLDNVVQADIIAEIIEVHTNSKDRLYRIPEFRVLGSDRINSRDLAALFCLADALSCDQSRILKGAKEDDPVTRFRRQVTGWFCDDYDENCIRIESVPATFSALQEFWQGLQILAEREMEPISVQLKAVGYPSKLKGRPLTSLLEREIASEAAHSLPGLDFYTETDEGIFRGREQEVEGLLGCILNETPLSALFGRSGVGKTSLVRAGLFPVLRKMNWQVVHCRLPLNDINQQIIRNVASTMLEGEPFPETIIEVLERVDKRQIAPKALVVLDQFENAVRPGHENLHELERAILHVMARRFPSLRFLLVYQTEVHSELVDFLSRISILMRQLPSYSLLPLTREGAKQALEALLSLAQVGVDPNSVQEDCSLIDVIINEMGAQYQGFFPPYLQMVAVTLTKAAKEREGILTMDLYRELGAVPTIIGRFLLSQLKEFGSNSEVAKNVLKALVGEGGYVMQKSFKELEHEVKSEASLRDVLKLMEARRLIRPLEGDQYEIIHPHLARLVDQELGEEEREAKRARERLYLKSREYPLTKDFLSMIDLTRLYLIRGQIIPDEYESKLLMHCCLAGVGPGWFWFQSCGVKECLTLIGEEALFHPSERVATKAAELLFQFGGEETLASFKEIFGSETQKTHPKVRAFAVEAIAKWGSKDDLLILKKAIEDPDWDVRKIAIEALTRREAFWAMPDIEGKLGDHRWSVRQAAVKAVIKLGEKDTLGRIQRFLEDIDPYKVVAALEGLVETDSKEVVTRLQEKLKDADWLVKIVAMQQLAKLKKKSCLQELKEMELDPNWGVRSTAFQLIGELGLGQEEVFPELMRGLEDTDWRVKIASIQAIRKLGLTQAIPALRKCQRDPAWDVRKAALKTIAFLRGGKESLPILKKFLFHYDANKQVAAAEAIVELQLIEAVPELEILLSTNPNRVVKNAIAKSLAILEGEQCLPLFRKLLEEGTLEVKLSVCSALSDTGIGTDDDVIKLARIVTASPLSHLGESANKALVDLDRKLYCPFKPNISG